MRWKCRQRGDYTYIHPNDDVNKSQSTNDLPGRLQTRAYRRDRAARRVHQETRQAFHDLADKHINDVTIGARSCRTPYQ